VLVKARRSSQCDAWRKYHVIICGSGEIRFLGSNPILVGATVTWEENDQNDTRPG